jgi:hypothetical protein
LSVNDTGQTSLINLLCKSVSLPFIKIDVESPYFGKKFYGKVSQENTFTIEVWNDDDFEVFYYFDNWFKKVYDIKTQSFISYDNEELYKDQVERVFVLNYYKIKTEDNIRYFKKGESDIAVAWKDSILSPSKTFRLNNVKILSMDDFNQDYEKGDGMTLKLNFVFDSVS